jgi:hypothetical protein
MALLEPLRPVFHLSTWNKVQVLLVGTILAPGKRTVTSALRAVGLADAIHNETSRLLRGVQVNFQASFREHCKWINKLTPTCVSYILDTGLRRFDLDVTRLDSQIKCST